MRGLRGKTRSLGFRFGLILLAGILAGQAATGFWFFSATREQLDAALDGKADAVGRLVAQMGAAALLSYDYAGLLSILDSAVRDADLIAVRVLDAGEREVAARGGNRGVPPAASSLYFPAVRLRRYPVRAGGRDLGAVEVTVSAAAANARLRSILVSIPAFLGLTAVLLSAFVYGFFSRMIAAPLSRLARAFDRIRRDRDLSTELAAGDDEIGRLNRGFNDVVRTLRSNMGTLRKMALNVREAVGRMEEVFHRVGDGAERQLGSVEEMGAMLDTVQEAQHEVFRRADAAARLFQENVASILEVRASIAEINRTTKTLFENTDNSYRAVRGISASTRQIASSSDELTGTIDETSVSVEEVSATVRQVAQKVRESARAADEVTTAINETGMGAVTAARRGMEKIREEVRASAETIQRLGKRSHDIEKILEVIREVTEQTNLLSLNAAILAAQAGEHGKGFGVVADEIGSLAERTSLSTHEIASIVETIRREIHDAVRRIEAGMERVEEGSRLTDEVEQALGQTRSYAESASEMARAIERATTEQARNIRYITESVGRIQEMNRQVAQAIRQQEGGLDELLRNVGSMRDAAEVVRKSVEEQNAGTQLIAEHLETTNDRVSGMTEATRRQESETGNLARHLEEIRGIGSASREVIGEMRELVRALYAESEAMKKEVEAFQLN